MKLRPLAQPFLLALLLIGIPLLGQQGRNRQQRQQQERSEEDKVHLLVAQVAEQFEFEGISYRRVIGPGAKFLHNNTIIVCDTALWNTATNVIDAIGNVEVIQENTRMFGETIHYMGDYNTGEVRGRVVELIDQDNNRLRTQFLNFNTKDSIGYFFNGGSMVDNKGTIMESRRGYYYSKERRFCLYEHVELGADTIRVKSDSLYYYGDTNIAEYWGNVEAWHKDGYIASDEGSYDRENEIFDFLYNVYIQTDDQEIWAQEAHYERNGGIAHLLDNVQIVDTTQQSIIFGNRVDFRQDPDWLQITDNPAAASYEINQETGERDTTFIRADTLLLMTLTYGTMDSLEFVQAKERIFIPERPGPKKDTTAQADSTVLADSLGRAGTSTLADSLNVQPPVTLLDSATLAPLDSVSLRRIDSLATVPTDSLATVRTDSLATVPTDSLATGPTDSLATVPTDSLATVPTDSLATVRTDSLATVPTDSLATVPTDSLAALPVDSVALARAARLEELLTLTQEVAENLDKDFVSVVDSFFTASDSTFNAYIVAYGDSLDQSVPVRLFYGYHNVRLFRSNAQAICDSVVYNDIDSVGRLYGSPVLWNEESQISSDSLYLRTSRDSLFRADFLSSGFIISQEDTSFFHQIKGDEMYAHIRDNDIYEFEVKGNVRAIFYIPEDSLITSANIKECSTMLVKLRERRAQRITYSQTIKSDMIPLFDLSTEQGRLSDFNWRASDRPVNRYSITDRSIVKRRPRWHLTIVEPAYPFTFKYFPEVYKTPAPLRNGVATNARDELTQREKENRMRPFVPLLVPSTDLPPESLGDPSNLIPSDSLRTRPTPTMRRRDTEGISDEEFLRRQGGVILK